MNTETKSDRSEIEAVIAHYLNGINENDVDQIPLSEETVMTGPMTPTPLEGKRKVHKHLEDVAPFVTRIKLLNLVVEQDRAVAIIHYEGINGVRFEGCEYFLIRNGQIVENRVFYDTAKLMRRS